MEERSVPSDDILDDQVAYGDAHQKRNEKRIADLSSGAVLQHEDYGDEYPDKAEVARARDGYHKVIHKRRIKIIVKLLQVTKLELAEAADLFVGLVLELSLDLLSLLDILLRRFDDYPFHRTDSITPR